MESKADYEIVKLIDLTDWQTRLEERQRREIALARLYARDFNHGTDGHSRLVLIDKLADMLDGMAAGTSTPQRTLKHVLDIPYHSQHEADAKWFRRDCGPACVESVGEYFAPHVDVTTDEIMQFITKGLDRSTYIRELQRACEHFYGVELARHDGTNWDALKEWIEAGRPPIILVHYGSFGMRIDRRWTGGHYLVVVGWDCIDYQGQPIERVVCHDPNFYGNLMAQGAFVPIVKDHFLGMWNDCHKDNNPRCMALVPKV